MPARIAVEPLVSSYLNWLNCTHTSGQEMSPTDLVIPPASEGISHAQPLQTYATYPRL